MMMIRRIYLLLLTAMLLATALATEESGMPQRRMCRGMHSQEMVKAHRRAAASAATTGQYIGDRRQLVVLVSFSDQSFRKDNAQETAQETELNTLRMWNRILNEPHFSEAPFHGSVHDYFYDQSYGQLNLQFDLQMVALNESRVKYRSTEANDENSKFLVQDVVAILEQRQTDWTLYDWNKDGEVEQLLIIYAGKGMNDGGGSNTIWPHQWWMSDHSDCQPIEVGQGEKKLVVDSYCCVQELTGGGTYGVFGTICHEFSHCLGLPDIYYGSGYSFVDKWDLMDSGNYNEGGFLPCGYSGVERMMVGWITPTELTTPVSITGMKPLATDPEAYIIRNDAYHDEFYVIENRQKVGWDEPLPGSGIVIFHVNYDEGWKHLGWPNQPRVKKDLYIIAANNAVPAPPGWNSLNFNTLGDWAYPYQDNDSLTNNSAPASVLINANADGTKLMSKPIYNMSVRNGLANFDFMNRDKAAAITTTTAPRGTYTVLHTLGKVLIVRYANGEVRKVMR